jgi:hypothetical protein
MRWKNVSPLIAVACLIQGDDGRPVLREEPADRRDDAGSVRAADQQPADVAT